MNSNNITNIGDLVDTSGNNKIDMNVGGFTNAIDITTSNEVKLIQTTANNFISISGGGTNLQNNAGTFNIANNAGTVDIDATTAITGEAEQIDFNYTTNNFKVRNGLTNNFVIDPTEVKSFLNFVCPSINSLTPVGGLSSGTSNSATLGGSTAEQSILASTFVGSRQAPANTFQQGDAYVATLAGNFSSDGADTLTLRLKGGALGTTVLSTLVVPLNNSSGVYYELEINFLVRQIGVAGVADLAINYDFTYNQTAMGGSFSGERLCESNTTTFDTTILNQLDITAQFSSTSGSNSIETILSTLGKTY
jgi:hypothetical protein